jgi:hypothetical protein
MSARFSRQPTIQFRVLVRYVRDGPTHMCRSFICIFAALKNISDERFQLLSPFLTCYGIQDNDPVLHLDLQFIPDTQPRRL